MTCSKHTHKLHDHPSRTLTDSTHPQSASDLDAAEAALARRNIPQAEALFRAAQINGADPDRCAGGLWQTSMFQGDFAQAWQHSDAIRLRGNPDPNRFWNGASIDGRRVIIRCLHGLGDTIQMLRLAPLLRARAASVVYELQPSLLPLAPYIRAVDEASTWGDQPQYDAQLESMELPCLLQLTPEQLEQPPLAGAYIEPPQWACERSPLTLGSEHRPRIGLVTRASDWDRSRSVPTELLQPLLTLEAFAFWNLNYRATDACCPGALSAYERSGDDLIAFAANLRNLDLLITVDTFAAHLAGALGIPVWLLVKHAADWRWMLNRNDSPWYPTMRIFRQAREAAGWTGVLHAVREQLLLSNKGKRASLNR